MRPAPVIACFIILIASVDDKRDFKRKLNSARYFLGGCPSISLIAHNQCFGFFQSREAQFSECRLFLAANKFLRGKSSFLTRSMRTYSCSVSKHATTHLLSIKSKHLHLFMMFSTRCSKLIEGAMQQLRESLLHRSVFFQGGRLSQIYAAFDNIEAIFMPKIIQMEKRV